MDTIVQTDSILSDEQRAARDRLLHLRSQLERERRDAISPGVGRALETADYYLFLALTYHGYTDELFPDHR